MKVLIIGSGGREHALIWKLRQNPKIKTIFCAPGNAGTAQMARNVNLDVNDIDGLSSFARNEKMSLTVVGPEGPLALGIVDQFEELCLPIFGVRRHEARLESSKVFSKMILQKYKIPTAQGESFSSYRDALLHLKRTQMPIVIKADGLAQGKGVKICQTESEAKDALDLLMRKKIFGAAGERIIIEQFLVGEEVSYLGFVDGEHFIPCPSVQDYKKIFDGDRGENTGGMGGYSPVPWFDNGCEQKVQNTIVTPLLQAFRREGLHYQGILYIGLLFSKGIPYVLEFNVRFGDPETQILMKRLQSDLLDIFEASIHGKLDPSLFVWDPKPCVCVVLTSKGYPGAYSTGFEISGLKEIEDRLDPDVTLFHGATVLKKDVVCTHGGRVLNCVSLGNSYREACEKVYSRVETIRWQNMYFRKDIGRKLWENQK